MIEKPDPCGHAKYQELQKYGNPGIKEKPPLIQSGRVGRNTIIIYAIWAEPFSYSVDTP